MTDRQAQESENELYENIQRKRKAAALKKQKEQQEKLRKERVQKLKDIALTVFSSQFIILLIAAAVNLASVGFSVFIIGVIYSSVISGSLVTASALAALLVVTNAYTYWFNRMFSITYKP